MLTYLYHKPHVVPSLLHFTIRLPLTIPSSRYYVTGHKGITTILHRSPFHSFQHFSFRLPLPMPSSQYYVTGHNGITTLGSKVMSQYATLPSARIHYNMVVPHVNHEKFEHSYKIQDTWSLTSVTPTPKFKGHISLWLYTRG